jgi:hypothetical protein
MKVKSPMFVIVPSVAFVVGLGVLCYAFLGQYFLAVCWHLRHGNHTVIRGYGVRVPLLWRRIDYYGGNIGLERAAVTRYPSDGASGAIEWYPAAANQLVATDDQALAAAKRDASHPISPNEPGDMMSLVLLRMGNATIYCAREEVSYFSSLDCHMAGAPVVFRYTGEPEFEKDAESILSSMN